MVRNFSMKLALVIKQKHYERVVFTLRRHPLTFVPKLLSLMILGVIPPALYFLFQSSMPSILSHPVWEPALILLASVFYLSSFLFFYVYFIDYYLDIWVVTNDRIVDIEQFGLFSRTISEVDLFRIQDVTSDVHGIFATLFHYGNVSIKTASANKHIVFKNVPNPNKIREALIRLADEDRRFHMSTAHNE